RSRSLPRRDCDRRRWTGAWPVTEQAVQPTGTDESGGGAAARTGGQTAAAPASRWTVAAPAGQTAAQDGRFLGRGRELEELAADLERAGLHTLSGRPAPHSRVLLIAGRPGSGRTALAEEFVSGVAGAYPDGVLRARLTDPGGAPVPTERTVRD